jgi:hypothetical protein
MKKNAQAVVLEAGEASAGALDPLQAEVHLLGRSVGGTGAVVVEDLVGPALEGVAEGSDLGDLVAFAPDDGLAQ